MCVCICVNEQVLGVCVGEVLDQRDFKHTKGKKASPVSLLSLSIYIFEYFST